MAHSFYHHWQFLAPDGSEGSVDPVPLSLFEQYIDHLKDRADLQFTTLDNQNVLPRSAKTQLNLTASSTVSAVNQPVTFTTTLSRLDPATNQWVAVESGKSIKLWHMVNGVRLTTRRLKRTVAAKSLTRQVGPRQAISPTMPLSRAIAPMEHHTAVR